MLVEQTIFAKRYKLLKRMGQGAFSEVWKAEDTKAGNLTVALKIYAPEKGLDENGTKTFSEEFALVFNMSHQNLLTPTYFDDYNGSPYLVLPFCEKGSAMNMVGMSNEDQVLHFMHDVSSALAYLHENGVIHQDIKPDNVLIDSTGCYKVTDFGISTKMRSTLRRSVGDKKGAGTMAYMGPERFSRNPETIKASDIWSLGATVYELMCGDVPFGDIGGGMQKGGAEIPEIKGDYPAKLKELVECCLAKETWDRPTAEQISEICDVRIRQGYWDLSSLKRNNRNEPENNNSAGGRPTMRRVNVPMPEASETPNANLHRPQPEVEKHDDNRRQGKIAKIILGVAVAVLAVFTIVMALLPNERKAWEKIDGSLSYQDYYNFYMKYPDGEHASQARQAMLNLSGDEVMSQIRKAEEVRTNLSNTWQDFDGVVDELNACWVGLESLSQELADIETALGKDLTSGIRDEENLMRVAVQQKISALQQNINLGSTSEVRYVNELKNFKGLQL